MEFKLLESGRDFYLDASFDLSSNTELSILFKKPDDIVITKIKPLVVLQTVNATLPVIGAVIANEYVLYKIEVGLLDLVGLWCAYLLYTDTTKTPVQSFPGTKFYFTVSDPACPDN